MTRVHNEHTPRNNQTSELQFTKSFNSIRWTDTRLTEETSEPRMVRDKKQINTLSHRLALYNNADMQTLLAAINSFVGLS